MANFKFLAVASVAAALLVACGGGGDGDQSPKVKITSVKVIGDSISDSGTFAQVLGNRTFSVQGPTQQIWTEKVAAAFGVTGLCNVYQFTGTTFVPNAVQTGCTSYGVGGGRINNQASNGGAAAPFSITKQLADAVALSGGSYKSTDLLLIDGGGNDAADLITAYLGAATDGGTAFGAILGSLGVTPSANLPAKGVEYMTTLANTFYDSINTNALTKGATRVVILGIPSITVTPRFQLVLNSIAAAYGGGAAGAGARAQSEALFKSWLVAFDTQLKARAAGNSAVVHVDFYSSANDQFANPAQYGLTNVTTPACPATGVGTDGLPTYTFATCTDTALSATTPPAGATGGANWWKTYAFSDGFHPTPFGYQLIAQLVSKSLIAAGWL